MRPPPGKAHSHSPPILSRAIYQTHFCGGLGLRGKGQSHRHTSEGAGNAPSMTIGAVVKTLVYTDRHSRPLVLVRLLSQGRLRRPSLTSVGPASPGTDTPAGEEGRGARFRSLPASVRHRPRSAAASHRPGEPVASPDRSTVTPPRPGVRSARPVRAAGAWLDRPRKRQKGGARAPPSRVIGQPFRSVRVIG